MTNGRKKSVDLDNTKIMFDDITRTTDSNELVSISLNVHTQDNVSVLTEVVSPLLRPLTVTITSLTLLLQQRPKTRPTPTTNLNNPATPSQPIVLNDDDNSRSFSINLYASPSALPTNLPPTPELPKRPFFANDALDELWENRYDSDGYVPITDAFKVIDDVNEESLPVGLPPPINSNDENIVTIPVNNETVLESNVLSEDVIRKMTSKQLKLELTNQGIKGHSHVHELVELLISSINQPQLTVTANTTTTTMTQNRRTQQRTTQQHIPTMTKYSKVFRQQLIGKNLFLMRNQYLSRLMLLNSEHRHCQKMRQHVRSINLTILSNGLLSLPITRYFPWTTRENEAAKNCSTTCFGRRCPKS
jgi:hypothetical protein